MMAASLLHSVGDIIVSAQEIATRVSEMAHDIDAALDDCERVLVVGILKGSAYFTADLTRHLRIPVLISYTTISSYGWKALDTNGPQVVHDTDIPVKGCHVLIVEDIIDSGRTLALLKNRLLEQGALSVRIAVLLDLSHRANSRPLTPDFTGFKSSVTWVCGYGIDYKERYRNLSDIHQINNPTH